MLYNHEKEGGNPRPRGYMEAFRDTLDSCDLHDIGFEGETYTWQRRQIRERLDRAVANTHWMNMMNGATLTNLPFSRSDHRPLLLITDYQASQLHGVASPVKRFEAKWLAEQEFESVVRDAWQDSVANAPASDVNSRLMYLHAKLHEWDKSVLKKTQKEAQESTAGTRPGDVGSNG